MKYIPAEKLIAEIERLKGLLIRGACAAQVAMETNCKDEAYNEILSFITYLQQEQLEADDSDYGPYARQYPKSEVSQEQPNATKGKFNFPKFLYARTLDNKTIDISYAPQNMEAIEYVRNDFIEQEQPEVDLDREIIKYKVPFTDESEYLNETTLDAIARHFAEWGAIHLNARKEE